MTDRAALQAGGYALFKYDDGPIHSYPYDTPWLTDAEFSAAYEKVRDYTLVDRVRCYHLWRLARQACKVSGDFLEVGTWRGGTAALLSLASGRRIAVADTFEGVVKAADWEHYEDGAHADTSEAEVRALLDGLDVSATILRGTFPDQTGHQIAGPLALVHIDVDVYASARDTFETAWPLLSPGGLAVFDDYGFASACEGVNRFVHEIADRPGLVVVTNQNGQAAIVKAYDV